MLTKIDYTTGLSMMPAQMREAPRFLLWKFKASDKPDGKPRKVPYYANGNKRGVTDVPADAAQLVSLEVACKAFQQGSYEGLGFALGGDGTGNYWQGIDFDHLPSYPELGALLPALPGYVETSPSGEGVHAIGYGPEFAALGSKLDCGIEAYSKGRYFTVTGDANPGIVRAITDLSQFVLTVLAPLHSKGRVDAEVARIKPDAMSRQYMLNQADEQTMLDLEAACAVLTPIATAAYGGWVNVALSLSSLKGSALEDQARQLFIKVSSENSEFDAEESERKWEQCSAHSLTYKTIFKLADDTDPAWRNHALKAGKPQVTPAFTIHDIKTCLARRRAEWLIKGVLPKGGLAVVYGAPGSGKSFAVLDMVMHIAQGKKWNGRRVMQSNVVYVACEGVAGMVNRLRAHVKENQSVDAPFGMIFDTPNFLVGSNHGQNLAEKIVAYGDVGVVVIDTLSRTVAGGNENAAEVMTEAVKQCGIIQVMTGAAVILVHHSGKDATKGARGNSALLGALDAEFEVTRIGDDFDCPRVMKNTKQKEGEDGDAWAFKLKIIHLYEDEDGDSVCSCVLENTKMPVKIKKMRADELALYETAHRLYPRGGEIDFVSLIEQAKSTRPRGGGHRDQRVQKLKAALKFMCGTGLHFAWVDEMKTKVLIINSSDDL
jgi:hypothetical protein